MLAAMHLLQQLALKVLVMGQGVKAHVVLH
jgi:hypothetical protein